MRTMIAMCTMVICLGGGRIGGEHSWLQRSQCV